MTQITRLTSLLAARKGNAAINIVLIGAPFILAGMLLIRLMPTRSQMEILKVIPTSSNSSSSMGNFNFEPHRKAIEDATKSGRGYKPTRHETWLPETYVKCIDRISFYNFRIARIIKIMQ
jgi:hypothetical protein